MDVETTALPGLEPDVTLHAVESVVCASTAFGAALSRSDCDVEDCSERVVRLILDTAHLHRRWVNVKIEDPVWMCAAGATTTSTAPEAT